MAKSKSFFSSIGLLGFIVGAFALTCIVSMILYSNSFRSGTEFSPDTFQTREFNYQKFPFSNWVISGVEYERYKGGCGPKLITDNWIKARPEKHWDLVNDSSVNPNKSADCDARYLVDYLQQYQYSDVGNTNQTNRWLRYCDDHPKCAAVFWPIIADMARQGMYLAIPAVMEFGDKTVDEDNVEEYEAALKKEAAAAYLKFGSIDEANLDLPRALSRYKQAVEITGHPDAVAARDRLVFAGVKENVSDDNDEDASP